MIPIMWLQPGSPLLSAHHKWRGEVIVANLWREKCEMSMVDDEDVDCNDDSGVGEVVIIFHLLSFS